LIAERRRLQHDEAVGEERSQDRPHAKVACSIGHQLRLPAHPMVRGVELNDEGLRVEAVAAAVMARGGCRLRWR
jgi:hypothetical protein